MAARSYILVHVFMKGKSGWDKRKNKKRRNVMMNDIMYTHTQKIMRVISGKIITIKNEAKDR